MLMMIGPVRFEVAPFNTHGYSHSHEATFVEKPVVGAMAPLEWVGEGPEKWSIDAKLFPERFGGMSDLILLQQARRSGLPQYLMRGDGALMGWVVIESVSERSSYLDRSGVGKVIDVGISVRRSSAPSAASYFSIMAGVFG